MTQDTPTLLFELEAQPTEAAPAAPVLSTWTPPVAEPLTEPVPLPLLEEPAEDAAPVAERTEVVTETVVVETTEVVVETTEVVVEPPAVETEAPAAETEAPAAEPHPTGPRAVVTAGEVLAALDIQVVEEPAPERPLPAWARALGVFDLETTGVDTATARIVTAHVGVIDETGAVVERKDWIIDPGVPIPEGAAAVHGITDERARRFGRPPGEVIAEILAAIRSVFARGFPLVVYNAPYDLTLLAAEADRHRLWRLEATAPIIDPFVLDKQIDRYRKGKRTLTAAAEVYGVALTDAHDAGADAIAAGRVAQAMARRYPEELERTAQELHDAQVGWCAEQAERFQAYMREKRDPGFTTSGAWPHR